MNSPRNASHAQPVDAIQGGNVSAIQKDTVREHMLGGVRNNISPIASGVIDLDKVRARPMTVLWYSSLDRFWLLLLMLT
jgi:hypothetical protein